MNIKAPRVTAKWDVLIQEADIKVRICEIGKSLLQVIDESDRMVVFVVLAQGAVPFFMKLKDTIPSDHHHKYYWKQLYVSSYDEEDRRGEPRILFDATGDISECNVIVVDDIADSRQTLWFVEECLRTHKNVHSVQHCVLLNKPDRKRHDVPLEWVGFNIPDVFVVGCGLDAKGDPTTRNFNDVRYEVGEPLLWKSKIPTQFPC